MYARFCLSVCLCLCLGVSCVFLSLCFCVCVCLSPCARARSMTICTRAREMCQDMALVGATAIEDKLQEGVPDTIAMLARAGIKIWVLTGDKMETAENIAFACRLLSMEMQLHRIVSESASSVREELKEALDINREFIGQATEHIALIIEGRALMLIMDDEALREDLIQLGQMCKAVVACRVSPDQKRQMVSMVRNGIIPDWRRWQDKQHRDLSEKWPMTLAIGDGANDVPMILEAHVGVGISGNEGLQAVRSADYAIAQFRYLQRLLLVHGRNNYIRVARLVIYVFFKNTVCVTTLFLYNIYSGWSGTTIFPSFLLMCYNVLFTGVPVIVYGFLEQDVKPETALKFPQLYIPGQRKSNFNARVACFWGLDATVHTLIVFFIPMGALSEDATGELYFAGSLIMTSLVVGMNLRLVLMENHISYISHLAVGCSILLVLLVMLFMSVVLTPYGNSTTTFDIDLYYGAGEKALGSSLFWFTAFLTIITMVVVDVSHLYLHRMLYPDQTYVLQERERLQTAEDEAQEDLEMLSDGLSIISSLRGSSTGRVTRGVSGEGLTPLPGSFRNSWEVINPRPAIESGYQYTPTSTSLYMRDPPGGMTIRISCAPSILEPERIVEFSPAAKANDDDRKLPTDMADSWRSSSSFSGSFKNALNTRQPLTESELFKAALPELTKRGQVEAIRFGMQKFRGDPDVQNCARTALALIKDKDSRAALQCTTPAGKGSTPGGKGRRLSADLSKSPAAETTSPAGAQLRHLMDEAQARPHTQPTTSPLPSAPTWRGLRPPLEISREAPQHSSSPSKPV